MIRLIHVELDDGSELRCFSPSELAIHEGDSCVVAFGGVLEFGRVSQMSEVDSADLDVGDMPQALRRATLQDCSRAGENALYRKMAEDACCRLVEKHKLNMQIVNVRQSFDRKVVTISYTAEQRVEFGDLVKDLSAEIHARVEMRQIGVRDAAGVVGGLGPCGRLLCCSSWLEKFEAVSVRMAKNQRLSLNPNTISGVCGRLKCCLCYENECYAALARGLPRDGTSVVCPEGRGCVVDKNILAQRVSVRLEDERIREFDAGDVVVEKR